MESPRTGEGAALPVDTQVGEYRIVERLGQGGMATVYGAVHPFIGKRAAVKIMSPALSCDLSAVARFVQEARAVNRIRHPNIVDVFSFGRLPDGRSYYLMEWLDGVSLEQRLRKRALGLDEALAIAEQIADALEAAHAAGVIHRDLKPANVLLEPARDGRERAKLLDFGVAKLMDAAGEAEPGCTRDGCVVGTPEYMAPEQARGKNVDGRADLYSLGVMLYELVTGRLPFLADNAIDVMRCHLSVQAPRARAARPALPRELDRLIAGLLDKRAERRPTLGDVRGTLGELRRALAAPRPRRRVAGRRALLAATLGAAALWATASRAPTPTTAPRLLQAREAHAQVARAPAARSAARVAESPAARPPVRVAGSPAALPAAPASESIAARDREPPRARPAHRARKHADPDYLLDPFGGRR